jgi:hypothetical protein
VAGGVGRRHERTERVDGVDRDLPRREHGVVVGPLGQVRPHAHERLEVDALAPEAGPYAVAPAKRPLGDDDRVGRFEAVLAGELRRDVRERGAREHRLHAPMARGEVPPATRPEQPGALFEKNGAALLVVDAPRGPDAEVRRRREHRLGSRRG